MVVIQTDVRECGGGHANNMGHDRALILNLSDTQSFSSRALMPLWAREHPFHEKGQKGCKMIHKMIHRVIQKISQKEPQ